MAVFKRKGYGQVEPNHLSAQRTGQIYAQLPAASGISQLENGQFLKYDYENNQAATSGDGEWMLVYNEVKLYDERLQSYKDFVLKTKDAVDKQIVPRLFKTNLGDIYTTNTLEVAGTGVDETVSTTGTTYDTVGTKLTPNENGFLATYDAETTTPDMIWKIVKVYTMPDGQPGVKIQRIK